MFAFCYSSNLLATILNKYISKFNRTVWLIYSQHCTPIKINQFNQNRSTFAEVMHESILVCFYGPQCMCSVIENVVVLSIVIVCLHTLLMLASNVDPWPATWTLWYVACHAAGVREPRLCHQQFCHVWPADVVFDAVSPLRKLTVRLTGFDLFFYLFCTYSESRRAVHIKTQLLSCFSICIYPESRDGSGSLAQLATSLVASTKLINAGPG